MMECLREEWNNEWKERIKEIEEKYRVQIEGIENKKRGEWTKYVKDKIKDYIRRRRRRRETKTEKDEVL